MSLLFWERGPVAAVFFKPFVRRTPVRFQSGGNGTFLDADSTPLIGGGGQLGSPAIWKHASSLFPSPPPTPLSPHQAPKKSQPFYGRVTKESLKARKHPTNEFPDVTDFIWTPQMKMTVPTVVCGIFLESMPSLSAGQLPAHSCPLFL